MIEAMPQDTTADLVPKLGLNKHVRLAIIDSDRNYCRALSASAQRSDLFAYDVDAFFSFEDGVSALDSAQFHVALVEHRLAQQITTSRFMDTPLVIISHRAGPEASRLDGVDVVERDDLVRASVLDRVVRHALVRALQDKAIERSARFDHLTGLANRSAFRTALEQQLASRADPTELSVVYIDIDGFKAINDRYGHATGDAVLKAVGIRLRDTVGVEPVVARLGGDEFALLVDGGEARARRLMSDLDRALEAPVESGSTPIRVHASMGAATFPTHGRTADRLVDYADRMMYGAKSRTATASHAGDQDQRWWRRRQRLVDDFPRALENGELHLVFQPQIGERGDRVRSIEVLTRWQHPSLGSVPPSEFIPAIERCGLAYALDSWVIRRALETRRDWPASASARPRLAVNVSARSLAEPSLISMLSDGLQATGQAPSDIEIELTETAMLDPRAAPVMEALRARGIALAIDDFGVGHTSLACLAQTPATVLKLDRTLLVGAAVDERHERVLRWAIRLGRDLGMEIVAEGIEMQTQLDWLRQQQVDGYQGYLFVRPLPNDELLEWLRTDVSQDGSAPRSSPVDPPLRRAVGPAATPADVAQHSPC